MSTKDRFRTLDKQLIIQDTIVLWNAKHRAETVDKILCQQLMFAVGPLTTCKDFYEFRNMLDELSREIRIELQGSAAAN